MKRIFVSVIGAVAFLSASTVVYAASKTVTLAIPGMTCPVCPITVKKALSRVEGVTQTSVNLDKKEARVTFDDTKTSIAAIRKATADAGYPSSVEH